MLVTKIIIENDFLSKEKLLKYYDLAINHVFPYVEYYEHCIVKSKNSKITPQEFKSLADQLRIEIEDKFTEDNDGELSNIQSQLSEGSIFSETSETIHYDLEEEDSLDFSDSIIISDDFIFITFCDPKKYTGDFESGGYFETAPSDSEKWQEGLNEDGVIRIQVKDDLGEYCWDANTLLGL